MTDVVKNDILDFDKKKKKKKTIPNDLKPTELKPQPEAIDKPDPQLNLEGKKKKKAKKVNISEEVDRLAEDISADLEFGQKKRKKPVLPEADLSVIEKSSIQLPADLDSKDPSETGVYNYEWVSYRMPILKMLLQRVFKEITMKNPELISDRKRRLVMLLPQLARIGSKKTSFVNFTSIAQQLKRDPAHLSSYLLTELGTTGSLDANRALLMRGRYQTKHIETVLRNYCLSHT
ncbi:unnamed protein product [Protopolystoma xenopodis]|uniref:Eukaryotic translation initiation factor 2 subunit 2 n=1 Tax=Protopolystoma xenopodis TaxID=117903 RepID=A0A3S4ZHB7_9PLAT|nr:unnamed protein product [Protopolystoma xenopodis]